jgi:stage V sporulation protein AC
VTYLNNKEEKIKQKFKQISSEVRPKSQLLRNCFRAFLVGGILCDIGQFFYSSLTKMGLPKDDVSSWVSIIMVFIGAFLTGIGIYDKLATFAGAGSLVPITGFANSIVSPAMEFKREGFIFGVGAKMFVIAGPVLVYGIGTSVVVGILYYLFK